MTGAPLSARAPSAPGMRGDIQSLRTLAVLGVVVFHLWPGRLSGGYAGVDVFFVISGFLITGHLIREIERTGTIRLRKFWSRRAVRLLPAALLVLVVSLVGTLLWIPSARWPQFIGETIASTFYVENWFLAALSVDYLGADSAPSAVQHYWSLSVEEQFYIVTPLMLILLVRLARRRAWSIRATVGVAVVALFAISLAYSIWYTPQSSAAYFSTLTRAWEFALGAAIAALPERMRWTPWLSPLGVAIIVASYFILTEETPFPGFAALLPVTGAALVLGARAAGVVEAVGARQPVSGIARASYAIYLWHWPLIIFASYWVPDGSRILDIGLLLATIALGWLTTVYWEEPLRFSKSLLAGKPPRAVAGWTSLGAFLVVIIAAGGLVAFDRVTAAEQQEARAAAEQAEQEGCFGAEAMVNDACSKTSTGFTPALADIGSDDANRNDCWAGGGYGPGFNMCEIGTWSEDRPRVLVLGDSHSNTLIGAYERMSSEEGWSFRVAGHSRCYLTTATLTADDGDDQESCNQWRERAIQEVESGDYDAIIVTRSTVSSEAEPVDGLSSEEAEVSGMVEAWNLRPDPETPVIVIRDNPSVGGGRLDCLETNADDLSACDVARDEALKPDLQSEAAGQVAGAHEIDFSDLYCTDRVCPSVMGNVVVYRDDGHHLTATYIDSFEPMFADALRPLLSAFE